MCWCLYVLVFFREECISVVNYYVEEINVWDLQEHAELDYKLRFCRCRGCVAELHRETTDYYTTSFSDSRKIQSHGIFPQNLLRAARGREYTLYNTYQYSKLFPRCARLGIDYKDQKAVRQTTNNSEILKYDFPGN